LHNAARPERKVIITCAITGAIHTPSMSPYLPVTPGQIAASALEAAEAGASILHLHARDPQTGKPDQSPQAFAPILSLIKGRCDAVVLHMKRTADRLFGTDYHWSVLGAGRHQMPIAAQATAMGGNVRVGLEDSLWIGSGLLAETNATQVRQVRQIIEGLGLAIATPEEARATLALKGAGAVGF
jgi:uncharacterized protein (DUF849 family)